MAYTDEEALRIIGEHTMTLKGLIENEQHNLDLFNLEVAKFRLKHRMSTSLIHLYGAMGGLSHYLIGMEKGASRLSDMWGGIVELFQLIRDKEKKE